MKSDQIATLLIVPALIFGICLNVLIWHISQPDREYFDEFHYVSAARQIATLQKNENWTHPPLAKELVAVGIRVCGDTPLGWRVMSAVFGSLGIVAMYFLALFLFGDAVAALSVALLSTVNQFHFLQSRIAMLDVFMFFFAATGLAAFVYVYASKASLDETRTRLILFLSGACFGFSAACKWIGIVPAIVCIGFLLARKSFGAVRDRRFSAVMSFIVVPPIFYALAFVPLLAMSPPDSAPWTKPKQDRLSLSAPAENNLKWTIDASTYSIPEVIEMQFKMFRRQLEFANPDHPYQSSWWSWPLMKQPMWFEFRTINIDGRDLLSAVMYTGNPVVVWTGFFSMLACAWLWFRRKDDKAFLILTIYAALWLVWAVIPRNAGFLYYYYPPAMVLGLGLVHTSRVMKIHKGINIAFLVLSVAWFVYFWPIITGDFHPTSTLYHHLWFFAKP